MTRREATAQVIRVARELVANIRCVCHECWTGRGQHDPKGCAWEDIADLRAAVNVYESQQAGAASPAPFTPPEGSR